MHFCPKCNRLGYRCMGAGTIYFCSDPECLTRWSEDEDGKVTIEK